MTATTATEITSILQADGFRAKEWTGDNGAERVYLSRKLSRGWQQIGYILVEDGIAYTSGLDRNRAGIRNMLRAGGVDAQ